MKKIIILAAIIGSVGFLFAQSFEISFWNNIRNSSYTIEDNLHIRCETLELPNLQTDIFYTTQEGWESEEMQQVAGFTYGAIIPALQSETQYCRFKTETDTLVGMMPAFISDDIFPPAIEELSYIASDPAGDVLDPECPNLDITGSYFGYSDSRFYGALTSDSGDFPLDCGGMFPISFYFYVTCIVNPENVLVDSVVYAMIYADVPVLLSPGLYKITGTEFSLETFELIGSIEAQVIDTVLVMACDIETLVNDELFGDWPNVTNSLGVETITARYTLPTEFLMMDFSKPSLQNIDQYTIEPFTNVLPEISNTGCSVGSGFTAFNCTYYDQNGHFPIIAEIEIESTTYPILPTSFDYSEPVEFFIEIPETNWGFATFRFSDNGYEFVEETIENNTGINDLRLPIADLQLSNYPNPFNPAVAGAGRSPTTTIKFSLTAEDAESAELVIYNIKGQKVKQFSDIRNQTSVVWDGTDENNQPVSSGIYLYKLSSGKFSDTKKMILIK